jgi:GT2 family glycosyltransferase
MDIPLIIPNFNQVTYLRNSINWFRFYYPKNAVWIIDNGSSYPKLWEFYASITPKDNIKIITFQHNLGKANLATIIRDRIIKEYEYFIVSDPDIMPYPSTPKNFLNIFRHCIDTYGYNRVGFCLKINDLPLYVQEREEIIKHESRFWQNPQKIIYEEQSYIGYKAPIDTTFALYRSDMLYSDDAQELWENSLRILEAFHLGWYLDPQDINEEMDYYFKTSHFDTLMDKRTLYNSYRPKRYKKK